MENNMKIILLVPENYWEERQWLVTRSNRAHWAATMQCRITPTSFHHLKAHCPHITEGTLETQMVNTVCCITQQGMRAAVKTCPFKGQADRNPQERYAWRDLRGCPCKLLTSLIRNRKPRDVRKSAQPHEVARGDVDLVSRRLWLCGFRSYPITHGMAGPCPRRCPQEGTSPGTPPSAEPFSNKI